MITTMSMNTNMSMKEVREKEGKERMGNLDDLEELGIVEDRNIQGRGLDVYVVGLGGLNVTRPGRFVSGALSPKRL